MTASAPSARLAAMSPTKPALVPYWRPLLERIDPHRPLQQDNVARLYAERQDAPYRMITTRLLRCAPAPGQTILLYGARGAGKSSELARIAAALRDDFAVVQVDLGAGLPEDTSTLALVLLLGVAALAEQARWGDDSAAARRQGGVSRLNAALRGFGFGTDFIAGLLEKISPILALTGADPGATAALRAGLSTASALAQTAALRRELGRGALAGRLPPDKMDDARAVVDAINSILSDLATLAGKPPLLLADGLDKRTNLDDVAKALADYDLLAELAAPIVLTGPVVLRHDPRFRTLGNDSVLHSLPNVAVRRRVHTQEGYEVEDNPQGIALLRDLFDRRMRSVNTEADAVIDAEALAIAARMSSGIIREFLVILTNAGDLALEAGERKIAAPHVEAAVRRLRLSLQGSLDSHALGILARVVEKPGILPADPKADVLLYENFIACYANGDLWYRPHEAIVDSIRENARADDLSER